MVLSHYLLMYIYHRTMQVASETKKKKKHMYKKGFKEKIIWNLIDCVLAVTARSSPRKLGNP